MHRQEIRFINMLHNKAQRYDLSVDEAAQHDAIVGYKAGVCLTMLCFHFACQTEGTWRMNSDPRATTHQIISRGKHIHTQSPKFPACTCTQRNHKVQRLLQGGCRVHSLTLMFDSSWYSRKKNKVSQLFIILYHLHVHTHTHTQPNPVTTYPTAQTKEPV